MKTLQNIKRAIRTKVPFFRKYKKGQVITLSSGHTVKLLKFVEYNNVFDEYWIVSFENLGGFQDCLGLDGDYSIAYKKTVDKS